MSTSHPEPGRVAVIVRNPRARRAIDAAGLRAAADPLRDAGWRVELVDTAAPAHATALARDAAAAGAEVVVACGGDGTVGEVAHALAGTSTALAVVPAGTANVWAREARIPRHDAAAALTLLARGRRLTVDVGEAAIGDAAPRRFILVCSVGVDAAAVASVESHARLKRWLGRASFIVAGAAQLAMLHPTEAEVAIDGDARRAQLLMGVFNNTRLYGGMVPMARAARVDDGQLDAVTFDDWRPGAPLRHLRYASLALRVLLGRLRAPAPPPAPPTRGLAYRRAERVTVRPARPLAVEVDGEAIGACDAAAPLAVRVLPRALTVVVGTRPNRVLGDE